MKKIFGAFFILIVILYCNVVVLADPHAVPGTDGDDITPTSTIITFYSK